MIVNNRYSLQAGQLKDLAEFWRQRSPDIIAMRENLMFAPPWKNLYEAPYGWKQDVPMPVKWPKGTELPTSDFDDVELKCSVFKYGTRIQWDQTDAMMDQLGDLQTHAQTATENYLTFYRYLIADYLNGTTDYIERADNSYDGAGLFSAVDGNGQPRMAVAGGNLLNSSGLSAAGIYTDYSRGKQRWNEMKRPLSGIPVFSPLEVTSENIFCIIPPSLERVFKEISEATNLYVNPAINTAQSNVLATKVNYQVENLLTDSSDWYMVLRHKMWKPFLYRGLDKIEAIIANSQNSDDARKFNIEALFAKTLMGTCPFAMFTMIKVNA